MTEPDFASLHCRGWSAYSPNDNRTWLTNWLQANYPEAARSIPPIHQPRLMRSFCFDLHNQWLKDQEGKPWMDGSRLAIRNGKPMSAGELIAKYELPLYATSPILNFPAVTTPDWPSSNGWLTLHHAVSEWAFQCFQATGRRLVRIVYGGGLKWFLGANPVIAAQVAAGGLPELPQDFNVFGVDFMHVRDGGELGPMECLLVPGGADGGESYTRV